ncbi:MAG: hypothetical protein JWL70_2191, partial [Acidimicrobiia bacterium]|nr:hypothetical protein [Acidimicrobiia bacterium]
MTNPKVASSSGGTISRRPLIDGLEGLTPGAAGDAVWLGRRRVDGTLARAIILDDPRLSDEFEDQLAAHADLLRLAGLHPRSVTFLGIERLNTGHRVLVTEHHPLGTLDRVLRTGKAPWPEVAAIGL